MNTNTGRIVEYAAISNMGEAERADYKPMAVPPTPLQMTRGTVGRNDPCPCASGKKFKRCCWTGKGREQP